MRQFNWLSYGHGHGQHIYVHICMVIIWSRLQSRTSSVKRDQNGTLILNSNVWHSAHSSQSGFACTAKKGKVELCVVSPALLLWTKHVR